MMTMQRAAKTLAAIVLISGVDAGCVVKISSLKCWTDFTTPPPGKPRVRVLGPPIWTGGGLTQEYCAQLCHDRKQPLAGVENGVNCMCGVAVVPPAAPKPSGCHQTMSGNKKERSGGMFEILTYSFTCSGAPVPPPPNPHPHPPPSGPCAEWNQANCSLLYNPCLNVTLPYHAMPFCDPSLSLERRASDMVQRMTLSEKISSLDNTAPAIAGLGTHPYQWWNEASTGVMSHSRNYSFNPTRIGTTKFAYVSSPSNYTHYLS